MAKIEAVKTAAAIPAGLEIKPSEGYDAMLKVILAAEPNFLPENIANGITIWGKTGTAKPRVTDGDWPFNGDDDVPSEDEFDDEAEKDDPTVPKEDKFVLVDNLGNITTGYMYGDEFEITYYDPVTTEFRAKGWRRVSYHTTGENAGTYTRDNFRYEESGGWNYLKNIRMCTREKLYYNGVEVWPNSPQMYSYNGTVLPELPEWDKEKYPYALITGEDLYGWYILYVFKRFTAYKHHPNIVDTPQWFTLDENADCASACGYLQAFCKNGYDEWGELKIDTSDPTTDFISNIIWASVDIRDYNNALYLTASDPIPV